MSDVVAPVPRVELEQPVERDGTVFGMVRGPREVAGVQRAQQPMQTVMHAVQDAE